MAHVTALAQHILALEPDKDAARLCFYHYLKNLCEATEPINSDLLNRFYLRAFNFTHWQENKAQLFNEVGAILQHYQDTYQMPLPIGDGFTPDSLQIVPVENLRTVELVIGRFFERHASPFDQVRVLTEGRDQVIAIVLQGDRGLRISAFPKTLAIRDGELVPLNLDFTVFYTPELVLHPQMVQNLEIGPHTSARFRLAGDGLHGTIIRGYTFQRYATMDGGGLHRYPIVFYPLKRLEQFFIDRKSDPMYIELANLLEKALDLMSHGHPEAVKFGEAALERGRLALEHIFPDDKLVRLLINNLEKTLALESARAGSQPAQKFGLQTESADTVFSADGSHDEDLPGTFEISMENRDDYQVAYNDLSAPGDEAPR